MFRKIALWLLLLEIVGSMVLFAQQDEEEPLPPPRRTSAPKIGGALGFTQNVLFLNLDPINEVLRKSNAAPFSGNAMLLTGAQGYGYVMVVNNLRVGGMGATGTRKSTSVDPGGNISRNVELSAGYGGVTVDYVIPVVPRLDLALGGLVGGGGMSFKMTLDRGNVRLWNDVWDTFGSATAADQYSTKVSGSFFVYQPSVNLEYAVLRWLGVRAGASYLGMAGSNWKQDDQFDVSGVPDNISGKGWMINGGIFVGTFIF
jgi:hypothetical protein